MGMFTPQTSVETDPIARILQRIAALFSVVTVGLLPLLFIPFNGVPILDGKVYLAALGVSIALIFSALLVFRVGTLSTPASGTLAAGWVVVLVSALSAALSGDVSDSLLTLSGGSLTTLTLLVVLVVLTVMMVLAQSARIAGWMLTALMGASGVLLLWHSVRLVTGADLSYGLFPGQTTSVAGGWNDVAIIAAGYVLATLLTISRATLKSWLRWVLLGGVALALFMLIIINNEVLWSILGVVSLTIIVMAISRQQVETTPALIKDGGAGWLLAAASTVFIATVVMLFAGSVLQTTLNEATNSSFVEVRPTVAASLDIVRGVWAEDALTGVGPAKFADAWRVHKADSINTSVFWDTSFNAGHNFIVTQAVEVGVLGLVAWLVFLGGLVVSGVRTFIASGLQTKDQHYQLALVAYVVALLVWICLFAMNPGVPVLIIAGALTGMYLGLSLTLRPRRVLTVSIIKNQRLGFVLVATLVVMIIGVLWFLQLMTQQVIAATLQNRALQTTDGTITDVTDRLTDALTLYQSDSIARTKAQIHLQEMRALLQLTEPTVAQQEDFQFATRDAAEASLLAVTLDATEPSNWYTRAQVFSTLAQAQVEGAGDIAQQAVDQAAALDPKNPRPAFLRAELALIEEDLTTARAEVTDAIRRKPDYTPALFLLAQIEIAEGNVAQAIGVTRSLAQLERTNPARYYQLGVLHQALEQNQAAIAALSNAIALDPDYANALYIRGVLYALEGEQAAAEADLARVLELNPDSELVASQLAAVQGGALEQAGRTVTNDAALQELNDSQVPDDVAGISEAAAETDLITTTTNAPDVDDESEGEPTDSTATTAEDTADDANAGATETQ